MARFALGEGYMRFTLDDRPLLRGLARVRAALQRTQQHLERLASRAKVAFVGLGAALYGAMQLAGRYEDTISKFKVVFGDTADKAKKFAETVAASTGRSVNQIMGLMAQFQDTFVPLGYAREDAAQFSMALAQLAIDLASFNAEVSTAAEAGRLLLSGIVGNHEALRAFGVQITETTLKAELLRMGFEGNLQTIPPTAKVLARLNLILEDTRDAHADAVRTAGSFRNRLAAIRAAAADLTVELVAALAPGLLSLLKALRAGIANLRQWVKEHHGAIVAGMRWTVVILSTLIVLPKLILAMRAAATAIQIIGMAITGSINPWLLLLKVIGAVVGVAATAAATMKAYNAVAKAVNSVNEKMAMSFEEYRDRMRKMMAETSEKLAKEQKLKIAAEAAKLKVIEEAKKAELREQKVEREEVQTAHFKTVQMPRPEVMVTGIRGLWSRFAQQRAETRTSRIQERLLAEAVAQRKELEAMRAAILAQVKEGRLQAGVPGLRPGFVEMPATIGE